MPQRINYDKLAAQYDQDHLREKGVDPAFLALAEGQAQPCEQPAVLDIGCGTGSQLIANQTIAADVQSIGLDIHYGMVQQAKRKASGIGWVQGDGAKLPFPAATFDLITNQFSFHHVRDKAAMIAEVFRLLRVDGQFVMTNISAHDSPNWIVYRYFPTAYEIDLQDFLPKAAIQALMIEAGFSNVTIEPTVWRQEEDLQEFAAVARLRVVSQLRVITEAEYEAGLQQIETDLQAAQGKAVSIPSEGCLVKITGHKSAKNIDPP